jgi:rhodanese-related sulfurtransferase
MDFMKREGFTEVYNLQGGINAWRAAGKPTVNCD